MDKFRRLVDLCKCSVSLSVDEHKDVYESVIEFAAQYDGIQDVDSEVLAEMEKRDTVVWLQWYPDTPIGFYVTLHYDVDLALDEALSFMENYRKGKED